MTIPKPGDVCLVFDAAMWDGKDIGDNSEFWLPATIEELYIGHEDDVLANVRFHHDGRLSTGHFVNGMKEIT